MANFAIFYGAAFAVAALAGLINGMYELSAILVVGGLMLGAWGWWTKQRSG